MTPEQAAAFVYSQAVSALIHLESMKAENESRRSRGEAQAYGEEAFAGLEEQYSIDHNSVISIFNKAEAGAER